MVEELRKVVQFVDETQMRKAIIVEDDKTKKGHEEKEYLLLITMFNDGDPISEFAIVTGRTLARQYIIDNIYDMDIQNSYVLVEGLKLEERITVYAFMVHIEPYYDNKPFDIEIYNTEDFDADEDEEPEFELNIDALRTDDELVDGHVGDNEMESEVNLNFPRVETEDK